MKNEDSHAGESLYYKELIALKDCSDKYRYRRLAFHRDDFERKKFIRTMFNAMMEEFKKKSIVEVCSYLENRFKAEFLRDWFDFDVQYETALQSSVKAFIRMAQYLANGFIVQELDVSAVADVHFSYKNVCIADISVNAPVVLQKDGKVVVVLFKDGVNPFSEKARKMENHPSYSIALICAYLAFEPILGSDIVVETWYLKSKDDKPGRQVDVFEGKSGKNIARFSFGSRKKALSKLKEILSIPEERNCNDCIHKDVCQISRELRINPEKQASTGNGVKPRFTPAQEEVVNFLDGAMCCIAVPGAGKTFSLANRLVNMLKKGISPSNILFVTFTKKAADELKERVKLLMDTTDENDIPDIFTFNAFGYSILRENPLLVGRRVKIANTVDRLSLIKNALSVCPPIQNVSYEGVYLEFGLIRMLSKLFEEIDTDGKEDFISRYESKKDVHGILAVYDEFCRLFKANGFISYDMQISLVNELFAKYLSLVKKYADKYRYVMVDEYQDTNAEQATMIYAIAKMHGNIVVVGDDDQNIYAWRGGTNRFMLEFARDFPSARIVRMSDNFRSNTGILASASELICKNSERISKELIGHKEAKFRPAYWKQATVLDVKNLITSAVKNGYKPGDIAILARTNKRLAEVSNGLEGVVKITSPKDYMREDTVFVLLYDVLTLFYNGMEEDISLYRVLTFLGAECTKKSDRTNSLYMNLTSSKLLPEVDKMQAGAEEKLEKMKETSVFHMAAYKLLKAFKFIQYSHGLTETLYQICKIFFDITTHPVIDNLIEKADEKAIVKIADLFALMKNMLLFSDDSRVGYATQEDAVNLLTAHDSKGKEFPMVIIYATEDFKDDPEETRLLYVAMTRAKDTLIMLESVYSTCELLPAFEASVSVR